MHNDKDTVRLETASDRVADLIRTLGPEEETIFDLVEEANGNDEPTPHLKITRRKLQPEDPRPPVRAESRRRAHVFNDAASFLAYLTRYGTEKTVIFADVSNAQMAACLDETAANGREFVTLVPQPHPLMEPWSDRFDTFIPLTLWALHVQKYRRCVVEPDPRALVLAAQQIRIAKEIEIASGFGKEFKSGIMTRTRIEGQDKSVPLQIPDEIAIEAPIFTATSCQKIQIDLTFDTQDHQVVVCMTASDYEMARLAAFDEMLTWLRDNTTEADRITLTTGRPNCAAWNYLAD